MRIAESYDDHRREAWRGKAGAYERSFASLCFHPVPVMLDALAVGGGTRVLDIGCGTGSLAEAAARRGAAVAAVDAEPSMVRATAERVPTARTEVAVLPALPFADATFDAVAANFVVNYVAPPAEAVAEMARVTCPGRRVAVTVWPHPKPPLQRLWDDVLDAAHVERPPIPSLAPEDDFPHTIAGLRELLVGAGLGAVESRRLEWQDRVDPEEWWAGAAAGIATSATS
ncbi:MAG: methyltransferase domain-containing protein [Actinomycetota bacterium]|nr:methyltransferase domain-containing protein [Actinomycetota bacterium]